MRGRREPGGAGQRVCGLWGSLSVGSRPVWPPEVVPTLALWRGEDTGPDWEVVGRVS